MFQRDDRVGERERKEWIVEWLLITEWFLVGIGKLWLVCFEGNFNLNWIIATLFVFYVFDTWFQVPTRIEQFWHLVTNQINKTRHVSFTNLLFGETWKYSTDNFNFKTIRQHYNLQINIVFQWEGLNRSGGNYSFHFHYGINFPEAANEPIPSLIWCPWDEQK